MAYWKEIIVDTCGCITVNEYIRWKMENTPLGDFTEYVLKFQHVKVRHNERKQLLPVFFRMFVFCSLDSKNSSYQCTEQERG